MVKIAPAPADRNDALARTLRLPLNDIIAATGVKAQDAVHPLLSSPEQLPRLVPATTRRNYRLATFSLAHWLPLSWGGSRRAERGHGWEANQQVARLL
jgi:hypothetical protein